MSAGAMTIEQLYDAMCRYLVSNGWRRQDEVSGWWWKDDSPEGDLTLGPAVEAQLDMDGLDTRIMRVWEPYEFWETEDDSA